MKTRLGVIALVVAMASFVAAAPVGAAATTQVVHAQTVNGWFGLNEGPSGSVGTSDLVNGPGALPAGSGSVKLTVDSTGRASIGSNQFHGTRLGQLTAANYWIYVTSNSGNGYPALQLDVDYDLNDANTAYQGRLSFNVPVVAHNTWVNVDALSGTFFRSNQSASPLLACGGACTLGQILAAYPNAGVRDSAGGGNAVLLRLGGPVSGGATVYADVLTIGTAANTTTVDFEPGATLQPNTGPTGTVVTATGYGYKPGAKVKFIYNGYQKPKKTLFCNSVADGAGTATCVHAIPSGTAAGNVGIHPITIKGRGPTGQLIYNPEFFLTP
jgi:hypothetical protein